MSLFDSRQLRWQLTGGTVMNGYARIIEGGLFLVNGTQHSQEGQPWPALNISFTDLMFTPWGTFRPDQDVRDQVKAAWRRVLEHLDKCHSDGQIPHGILLGGYAPAVAGIYHWARQMRVPVWVAVMAQTQMKDGEKKVFAPVGARQIFPQLSEPVGNWADQSKTTFHRVGARPLTDDRREILAGITPRDVQDKFEEYLLPPTTGVTPAELILYCGQVAEQARKSRASVLIDGLPAEALLYLVQACKSNRVQVYFLRTEIRPDQKIPTPIGVAQMPRF
jgi:hypothetical protein